MKERRRRIAAQAAIAFILLAQALTGTTTDELKLEFRRDDAAGRLQILIDGREALVYQYAQTLDLPHYWPLNSPSGKNMLVQRAEPYPHHRSFWTADTVRLKGRREVSLMWLGSGLTDPDISLAASLCFYGAYILKKPAALNGPQFLTADVLKKPLRIENGFTHVPTGPGLGIEVDEDKVLALMKTGSRS